VTQTNPLSGPIFMCRASAVSFTVSHSIVTMTLSLIKRHIGHKLRFLHTPLLFDAYVTGFPVGILSHCLVWEKLEWWGYQTVKKFDDTFSCFDTIHERNRHSGGRTPHDDKNRG